MSINYQLPIEYFVNASAVLPGATLEPLQVNTILILTDEEPIIPQVTDYLIARTASSVIQNYGTESKTAAMANAIFSPTPNLLAGGGYLVVAPFKNVTTPATSGTLTTIDVSSNLASLKGVAKGCLSLVVNGVTVNYENLDLTAIETLEDLATVLNTAKQDVKVTVNENSLVFTSLLTGENSTVTAQPLSNPPVITPAVVATSGHLTTTDISENLGNFKAVTDGVLPLVVDGTTETVLNLDFSSLSDSPTLAEVVNIIESGLGDNPKISVETTNGMVTLSSLTTGATSSVVYNSGYSEGGTNLGGTDFLDLEVAAEFVGTDAVPAVYAPDLYNAQYLALANAVSVGGTAEQINTPETLVQAITRLNGQLYTEVILTTRDVTDNEAIAAAQLVETTKCNILGIIGTSPAVIQENGLFQKLKNFTFTKPLYYSYGASQDEIKANARAFAASYFSRLSAVDFSASNTTLNMNLKDLAGVPADTNINETMASLLKDVGADFFASVAGLPKVVSNAHNNLFIDQVTNQIWFINTIKINVFNVLASTATKIGQSDRALLPITNAIRQTCQQAVRNGYLGAGNTWNSPDTFGDLDDFYRNIEDYGYYIYHLPTALQAQAERKQRKAPTYQVAAKELGAVNSANILVYIEA